MRLFLNPQSALLSAVLVFSSATTTVVAADGAGGAKAAMAASAQLLPGQVRYQTMDVGGANVFYRESGRRSDPAIVLLHGYPSSSHMFRDLIPRLSDRYRVIAPDYPGFGRSTGGPGYAYTFANYAKTIDALLGQLRVERYALYVMDYGAPVGFRIATAYPERITGLIVQNANAYDVGLVDSFWGPIKTYWASGSQADREAIRWLTSFKATQWQYSNGYPDPAVVSPDAAAHDQAGMDRPGNADLQLDVFYDYRTNVGEYPAQQAYFRKHQPPTLIVWGKNDAIFPPVGAHAYLTDLPKAELHLFDAGHFVLESHVAEVSQLMRDFLGRVAR